MVAVGVALPPRAERLGEPVDNQVVVVVCVGVAVAVVVIVGIATDVFGISSIGWNVGCDKLIGSAIWGHIYPAQCHFEPQDTVHCHCEKLPTIATLNLNR